jgi:hypothetical protein
MDLVKTIKAGDEHLVQLQNQMGLVGGSMTAEGKHLDQLRKEIHSMKMVVGRRLSVSAEQMVGDPASVESPVKMRTPRKSDTVASNAAAEEEKKAPISKIPMRLAPLPNFKAARSKIGSQDNADYKPGGSHVKMHTQKLLRVEVIQ